MGPKIKNLQEKTPVQPANKAEWTHQSVAASSQQKLFQSVLSKVQKGGKELLPQEINSLHREMKVLQMAIPVTKPGGKISFTLQSPKGSQGDGLSAVTAATMLRLNNLSPRLGAIASSLVNSPRLSSPDAGEELQRSNSRSPNQLRRVQTAPEIGNLSARFESGGDGSSTIGYDDQGGTSYGIYQISSRAGTMRLFVDYLKERAPDWGRRLNAAGPLNTGGRGGAGPREWKKIAAEDPERFAQLQQDFITQTHYIPALQEIQERTGVDVQGQSPALQEVLWSTAVQHGPRGAARIFSSAIGKGEPAKGGATQFEQKLIDKVYSARGKQFGGSSVRVASAVKRRFEEEKQLALGMLNSDRTPRSFRA